MNVITKLGLVLALGTGFACTEQLSAQTAAPVETQKAADTAKSTFQQMDTNKDGKVSKDELKAYWLLVYADADSNKDGFISTEERKARTAKTINEADANKDSKLSLKEELVKHTGSDASVEVKNSNNGAKGFDRIDTNNDGYITVEEYRVYVIDRFQNADLNKDGQLTAEERHADWEKNSKNMDKNNDGKVSKDEFVNHMSASTK